MSNEIPEELETKPLSAEELELFRPIPRKGLFSSPEDHLISRLYATVSARDVELEELKVLKVEVLEATRDIGKFAAQVKATSSEVAHLLAAIAYLETKVLPPWTEEDQRLYDEARQGEQPDTTEDPGPVDIR